MMKQLKSKQHKSNMPARKRQQASKRRVALAPKQNTVPLASGFSVQMPLLANRIRVPVAEVVGTVQVPWNTSPGVPVFQLTLNPLTWGGSRLQHEAALWQQFRFNRLKIRVIPSCSTLTTGQYGHGHDADGKDMYLGSNFAVTISALPGAAIASVWQTSVATCNVEQSIASQRWFKSESSDFNDPDFSQGSYVFALTHPISGITSGDLGFTFEAVGEIEFCGRRAAPTSTYPSQTVYVPAIRYQFGSGPDTGKILVADGYDDKWIGKMQGDVVYTTLPEDLFVYWQGGAPSPARWLRKSSGNQVYAYLSYEGAYTTNPDDRVPDDRGERGGETDGYLVPMNLPTTRAQTSFRARDTVAQLVAKGTKGIVSAVATGIAASDDDKIDKLAETVTAICSITGRQHTARKRSQGSSGNVVVTNTAIANSVLSSEAGAGGANANQSVGAINTP